MYNSHATVRLTVLSRVLPSVLVVMTASSLHACCQHPLETYATCHNKTEHNGSYAPITVMPHPPRLMVGGDFEGRLTPAACPLGGAFALHGGFLLHIHTYV